MDKYEDLWRPRAIQHDREIHEQNLERGLRDPSCPICHPIEGITLSVGFNIFWRKIMTMKAGTVGVQTFNARTIREFDQLKIVMENDLGEINVAKGLNLDPEENERLVGRIPLERYESRRDKLLNSIRYNNNIGIQKYEELAENIHYLIYYVILLEKGLNDEEETLENMEEEKFGSVIPREEVEMKFTRFLDLYNDNQEIGEYNKEETLFVFKMLLIEGPNIVNTSDEKVWSLLIRFMW